MADETPPNSHRPWTARDEALLAKRLASGFSWDQIAILAGRSVDSVKQRATILARRTREVPHGMA